jgi:hypothetical protein
MTTLRVADIMTRAAHLSGCLVGPDTRHTPSLLVTVINDSLERYHALKNETGHPHNIARVVLSTTGSAVETLGWPLNSYVTLPADFFQLVGASIELTGGFTSRALNPFSEGMSELQWSAWPPTVGSPEFYRIGRDTSGNAIMRLLPAADSVYSLTAIYIPGFTALGENDSYTFVHGTELAVVADVAMTMLESDGIQESTQYQAIQQRRDEARATLRRIAPTQGRAGVATPINDRGASRFKQRADFRYSR